MRTLLVLALIAAGLVGCDEPDHYVVVASGSIVVKTNQATGSSWILQRGRDGYFGWVPVGNRLTQ